MLRSLPGPGGCWGEAAIPGGGTYDTYTRRVFEVSLDMYFFASLESMVLDPPRFVSLKKSLAGILLNFLVLAGKT